MQTLVSIISFLLWAVVTASYINFIIVYAQLEAWGMLAMGLIIAPLGVIIGFLDFI